MPIVVKDYTWEESDTNVFITVPLKGVNVKNVDILSTEEYLKVSYPPYIFECPLYGAVDDKKSVAQIGAGAVVFKLEKQDHGLWQQLVAPYASDKAKMREVREKAIQRVQERSKEEKKEKAEAKRKLDKQALAEQMELENKERQRIDDEKESERKKATDELEVWKEEKRKQAEEELKQKQAEQLKIHQEKKKQEGKTTQKPKKPSHIFEEVAGESPVRQTSSISVSFTPRVFPTALRESQVPQEEEWLKKQAEARRIAEVADKDLSEEERNPVWMRDKGNEFFKSGDFQAAINAFSQAIRLGSKLPALYSNRAACHLKLGNLMKCAEDCSEALDLLNPPVSQNAASRRRVHVRRGTAFCHLEMYVEGLQDYEAALKIEDNEQLRADADRIRKIIQSSDS